MKKLQIFYHTINNYKITQNNYIILFYSNYFILTNSHIETIIITHIIFKHTINNTASNNINVTYTRFFITH